MCFQADKIQQHVCSGQRKFLEVETITFDYGQRHKIKLEAAKNSEIAKVKNRVISINTFGELGGNALTGEEEAKQLQRMENYLTLLCLEEIWFFNLCCSLCSPKENSAYSYWSLSDRL